MCGVVAFFAYGRRAEPGDPARVRRASERLRPRGPDGRGEWASDDGRVILGHRRLAIIDLSDRGAQPMRTADGRLAITFNGEIYNYRALRAELEAGGPRFQSDSDTEVLLHLYAERGEAMVHDLRGMFAFAIWDAERRGVFLARDPFGIKPLYVADDGRALSAASEVKALLRAGGADTRPEPAGHVGFFVWGYVPEPYTLYRGVRALPAGHTLWAPEGGTPVVRPYASVTRLLADAEAAAAPLAPDAAEDAIRDALRDSVAHHLVADVPVAVFLSAGLDSATLAALAAEAGGTLRTVTLGFAEQRGTPQDETQLAGQVAEHYGAAHQTCWITRADFREHLSRLLDRMDQPTTDGTNSYFVALAAARAGLKVALSGLGGDELFGGYPSFRQVPRLARSVGRLPGAAVIGRGVRVVSAGAIRRFTSPKYAGLLEYGGSYGGAYLLRRGMFLPWELPAVLDPALVREGWRELASVARLDGLASPIGSAHLRVSAMEAAWYMRNQLLRDTDWATMAHSVEVRTPLVDWTLWRRAAPAVAALGRGRAGKRVMASAPARPLPAALLTRPKTGFVAPTREWIAAEQGPAHAGRGLRGWARYLYEAAA